MRPQIVSLVHRVLGHGIRLRSLLRFKRYPDIRFLEQEHNRLLSLLSMAHTAMSFPDYAGDPQLPDAERYARTRFLGIRYALACWLDEIILDKDNHEWVQRWWNDRHLETLIFPPLNERNVRFWEQADLAEARPETDALEGYYLCVMLGFRGAKQDNPDDLREWRERVEPRILEALDKAWHPPARLEPPRNTDILSGRDRFRKPLALALFFLGALILFGTLTACHLLLR
jgi:type IV/VI secretion system ImpK/VasF family protein